MQLIPAIDVRGGRVVRLQQGDYGRETRYDDDPLSLAGRYAAAGAQWLHVVDLDSARGGGDANLEIIARICREVDIRVQTGGGVRELGDLQRRLDTGAGRVVVGSLCVNEPDRIVDWLGRVGGEALVAGLDVLPDDAGRWIPRSAGWTQAGKDDLFTLLHRFTAAGLRHLLCTDIERDGMLGGPSIELYEAVTARFPNIALQASGGIGKAQDLSAVEHTGAAGCIVGRALLEGAVEIEEVTRWSR